MWLSVSLIDGKKLDAFGLELAGLQRKHGAVEPVVRPAIIPGHADVVLGEIQWASLVLGATWPPVAAVTRRG